jgi:murein DD-endopeptidase MepM/ murein hydrolase activator NlpD
MSLWVRDPRTIKTLPLAISLALLASACTPLAAPLTASPSALAASAAPSHAPAAGSEANRPDGLPQVVQATFTPTPPTGRLHPTPTQTKTLAVPSITPKPRVCSPLAEVTLSEIPGLIAGNTFQTPQPGRDDGHPGIDLAFYAHGTRKTMLGLPIQAALAGKVAAVLPDRKPYGNLVIIETPLESLPAEWGNALHWPAAPAPTVIPDGRLTCPDPPETPAWNTARRSLYLAYGHMNKPSTLKVGDTVSCGQSIGEAGTTGASVNIHLHFEARFGPAGAVFNAFGHYDARSTAAERNNYCLWRVSNWFELIDPLPILQQKP